MGDPTETPWRCLKRRDIHFFRGIMSAESAISFGGGFFFHGVHGGPVVSTESAKASQVIHVTSVVREHYNMSRRGL
jgi:hypothetical protein